jgi:hypothetical protein
MTGRQPGENRRLNALLGEFTTAGFHGLAVRRDGIGHDRSR